MLFRVVVGIAVLVGCFFLYTAYGYRYVLDDIRENASVGMIMGPEDAPINILAYIDYGSSWSRRAQPILLQVLSQNPDVNVIIKPFSGVSENSDLAARIALAALQDNRFLDIHNVLMESPKNITKEYVRKAVQTRGMNYAVLEDRAYGVVVDEMVNDVKREALLLNIETTPQLYIENTILTGGSHKVGDLEDVIQDIRMGRR